MNTLLPTGTAPLEDDDLDNYLQVWVAAVCGLPPQMVRPRWQPEPANIPNFGVDWCALGVTVEESDTFAAEVYDPTTQGVDILRHQKVTCLTSFYGPNAGKFISTFRDGIQLAQNREYLSLSSMGLVDSGDVTTVPELVKERWLKRKDLPFVLRRQLVREYAVPTLVAADGAINNEKYTTSIVAS